MTIVQTYCKIDSKPSTADPDSCKGKTVDQAAEMRYLLDLGVDVITTNRPLLLREVLQEMAI